jgi:crotonobetainyl-CoA:carnitine CoA-transferase CaiB-like acyl-CoA transferase
MLARPEFASRDSRIDNYEGVVAFLAPIFRTRPKAYWAERLTGLEVPNSPVQDSAEVLASPQAQHLGLMIEADGPHGRFRTIRSPVTFDGERDREVTAPPTLGQHNAEILRRDRALDAAE